MTDVPLNETENYRNNQELREPFQPKTEFTNFVFAPLNNRHERTTTLLLPVSSNSYTCTLCYVNREIFSSQLCVIFSNSGVASSSFRFVTHIVNFTTAIIIHCVVAHRILRGFFFSSSFSLRSDFSLSVYNHNIYAA